MRDKEESGSGHEPTDPVFDLSTEAGERSAFKLVASDPERYAKPYLDAAHLKAEETIRRVLEHRSELRRRQSEAVKPQSWLQRLRVFLGYQS